MESDPYFSSSNEHRATQPGRFVTIAELPELTVAPGLVLQPLLGTGLMVSFARYEPGRRRPCTRTKRSRFSWLLTASSTSPSRRKRGG